MKTLVMAAVVYLCMYLVFPCWAMDLLTQHDIQNGRYSQAIERPVVMLNRALCLCREGARRNLQTVLPAVFDHARQQAQPDFSRVAAVYERFQQIQKKYGLSMDPLA